MDDRRWRRRLGRFAICLIVTVSASYADIAVRQSGPYLVLGKNLPWSSRFNDTWVFQPQNPDQGICIFVSNNDSSSHTFTLNVWQTGDPTIRQYKGNESRFRPDIIQGEYSPVAANSTVTAYVHTSAAAVVALQTSGGSGSGTADIYVVMTRAPGCGPVNAGAMSVQGPVRDQDAWSNDNRPVITGVRSGTIVRVLRGAQDGSAYVNPATACYQSSLTPVPTTMTDVTTQSVKIASIVLSNTTSGSINFIIQDKQTTPVKLFDMSLGANNTLLFEPVGTVLNGISWQAGSSGLAGQICYYEP